MLRLSFALLLGISSTFAAKQSVMLPMRDGTKLATDIYRPDGNPPFPVILIRTPYNKDMALGISPEGNRRGFVIVAQDCRGRFASEGENLPFQTDKSDGFDTIEWVAKQPWCNGKIGTWGGSAVAITQFQMLASGTDKISAQHLTVGAANLYEVIYVNGVFRKSLIEDWLKGARWSPHSLPLWTSHPLYDEYWQDRDASHHYKKVGFPAVHIGGYYDIFAQSTIDAFAGYQERGGRGGRGRQKLVMGPWAHAVLQEKVGELNFPNAKNPPSRAHDAWQWFDMTLHNDTTALEAEPAVTYYVIGDVLDPKAPGNTWRQADHWPPFKIDATKFFLHRDRSLSRRDSIATSPLTYTYDPANPAPTIGGIQLSIPAGPMDQRKVEERPDVLVFTSDPLTSPVEVTGRVRAKIWFSTDVPDTDFIARLCDVYPDGRSFNLCEGAIRTRFRSGLGKEDLLKPGQIYPLEIDLWSTSVIFNTGHRIRLHLTSSSAPGYDPNPNTGAGFRSNDETRKANIKLYVDAKHPSHLLLPVISP
jgi:predicted acyl esterase